MKLADELNKLVAIAKNTVGFRKEPFSVMLCGEPGRGKSFLATMIPFALAPKGIARDNITYTRNPGSKFWDGYAGQWAVFIEDFAQYVGADNKELLDFIYMLGPGQFRLDMAKVEEKGAVFTSRLLVTTTNSPYADFSQYVRSNMAILRRRDILAKVEVDPAVFDVAAGKVNAALVPKDYSHYRITLLDPTCPVEGMNVIRRRDAEHNWYSYTEFMLLIANRYRSHVESQEIAHTTRDENINRIREMIERGDEDDEEQLPEGVAQAQMFCVRKELIRDITEAAGVVD